MYTPKELWKGIRNPRLGIEAAKNDIFPIYNPISRRILGRNDPPIPETDWDNLLLLDACRYDLFKQCNTLPGQLEVRYSVASNTAEYVKKTFKGKKYPDIVCVTSTPKYYKPNVEDSFHDIIHVWEDDWDEEYGTVLPEVMNKRVIEAAEKYPHKRILAHYIPPHQPFIGETGRSIPHGGRFSGGIRDFDLDEPNLWEEIRAGKYERNLIWEAYKENLELALPAIEDIITELPGKNVVTSDHGNVFGSWSEFKIVGHPKERHIKPLIQVPWLVYQNGERKEIIAEAADTKQERQEVDEGTVNKRLEDLGYV